MNTAAASIEVLVKNSAGSHVTQTVRGRRASSTVSAGQAVARLAKKVHGVEVPCTFVETRHGGVEVWRFPAPAETAR